ncbi:hypothetical protein NP493_1197g00020 [Ridgeia piscesae]|uniref:Uncharacterized protein n=1 Tax=Ridgeia piscesae TaxID=27915 RepID=A0AAD9KDX0_RIDPI|nr:hypothetical protein NP493_1197g00020 [Ridgeia piscesae]
MSSTTVVLSDVESKEVSDDVEVTAPGEILSPRKDHQVAASDTYVDTQDQSENAPLTETDTPQSETTESTPSNTMGTPTPPESPPATLESPPATQTENMTEPQQTTGPKSLDPKDYGIDFEEDENDDGVAYEPPDRDGYLPDLNKLLATLDEGEAPAEEPDITPSLFAHPDQVTKFKKISDLKMEMEQTDIDNYVEKFETGVKDDVLLIGDISLEEVQAEELRLRDEHVMYEMQEAQRQRDRNQEILEREEVAKKRVAAELKEKRKAMNRREVVTQHKERLMMDRLHKSFRRSENQLISVLERRKGEVKTTFGDLTEAEGEYGGSKGRRWKVDWNKTPQPIEVKLKCMRGVKDKIPAGRYVLITSLHDRLGGHVMRWSRLKGQQWGGATLPICHDGHFYNTEIKLDQSVFTVLPPKVGIRPGMVLIFELFLLRGAVVPSDRVVAWGAFPIADGKFDVVEGKYKVPFLRGEMDPQLDKHEKIEALMASDIDHWMCNLYIDIVKLPRYLAGQKEYEVELQFSSGMLAYPDRVDTGGEQYRDGEPPVPGSLLDIQSLQQTSQGLSQTSLPGSSILVNSETPLPGGSGSGEEDFKKRPLPIDATQDEKARMMQDNDSDKSSKGDLRKRHLVSSKSKLAAEEDSDNSDFDANEDVCLTKKEEGFYPVKGQPGLFYKKRRINPVDASHQRMYKLLPQTQAQKQRRRKRALTYLEELDQHTFSVKVPLSDKGHEESQSSEKMEYLSRQFLAELGLSQWRSREFWGMLTMFLLVFFIRIYLHYVAQWIYLKAIEIPINKFDFYPYTVSLNYQNTLLMVQEEVAVVLLGPFGNIFTFVLLVLTSWLIQRLLGSIPDIGSKFILAVGIQAFLDPLLILTVDCILKRYLDLGGDNPIADFAKLYFHYLRTEGSGLSGILVTIFLYFFTCFTSGAILYMYFLRLHNNGRLLDIYLRLHGDEEIFFVPYDLEMSNHELNYISKKSEQWRGEEGERRKVAVYDYIWEEEEVEQTVWDENGEERTEVKEGKKEVTTHLAIHTLHLDGLRELHRHFLRLPDGAIVEVFGDMSMAGMDKDMTKALTTGAQDLEKLTGSKNDLNKGAQRQTAITSTTFQLMNEGTNDSDANLSKMD